MSTGRGSGAGGVQTIPAGSRTVVQSLKEIVNCPEAEIYATLKDCNMDPNEAINRLLTQDPFHEVKRKREKKKEGKDNSESRFRGANNSSSRGSKSGADRHLSRESPLHGKPTYKKENGSSSYTSSLSTAPGIPGNTRSREHAGLSVGASTEIKGSWLQTADSTPSSVQPAHGHQSAWAGVAGQVSMADVVRMGRPHNKAPNASHHNIQDPSTVQHVEEWPSIEKPAATNVISVPEYSVDTELHPEAPGVSSESINHHSQAEEVRKIDDNIEASEGNDEGFVSISSRKSPEDDSRGQPVFEDELYKNMGSYQSEVHDFEHHENAHDFQHHELDREFEHHEDEEVDASVSSVTENFQQLSVTKDDSRFPSGGTAPAVVIPDHLQVQTADCSHLSFGSFGSGMTAAYSSGITAPVLAKNNLEEAHREADISSSGHLDTRHSEYYVDDAHRNASDGSLFHRNGASGEIYDASSASQPEELLKPESAEVTHGNQYAFPSSTPGYTFDDSQHLNAAFNQTSAQMQNLAQFSNIMHSQTNSLPSTLLTANAHPTRESELHYSQFPVSQSMSARYGNSVSSVSASALSISEALKSAGLSSTQPAQQVASGPPLPQQLALHPYSQTALPLGQYANMMGYPFLPQSYTYMPSAFQQSLAGSSAYHQSLAAVLPQYKNSISVSSLPQSAAVASGYGAAFGNNTTNPGNYPMNPPAAAPSSANLSYDDVLSSQYKESSHLLSLQQNDNSAMWLHGHNSRTMPAVPASTFYNFQGQSHQQPAGFRQVQQHHQQQQSPNYGAAPGYNPNFYHSQTGISLEQLQNPRDGSVGGSQGQPKPSQIWPNGY